MSNSVSVTMLSRLDVSMSHGSKVEGRWNGADALRSLTPLFNDSLHGNQRVVSEGAPAESIIVNKAA